MDLMFKATDKMVWDAFVAPFIPNIITDEIGPIVITPAIFDDNGEIITSAVIDNAHHINVRVINPIIMSTDEEPVEIDVCATMAAGGPGVEWIDPAIVTSPERIWAGGMNYWPPQIIPNEMIK